MAAESEYGAQTKSLVHDSFILNMENLAVPEKRRTKPMNIPREALNFALAYDEETMSPKSNGETQKKVSIETEQVCKISQIKLYKIVQNAEHKISQLNTCKRATQKEKSVKIKFCEASGIRTLRTTISFNFYVNVFAVSR